MMLFNLAHSVFTHDPAKTDPGYIYIPYDRAYNFVWIDSCNSAGGVKTRGGTGEPSSDINLDWYNAFNLSNIDTISTFVGFNGKMLLNTRGFTDDSVRPSPFLFWRVQFWKEFTNVGFGLLVSQAFNNATAKTKAAIPDLILPAPDVEYPWYGEFVLPRTFILGEGFLPGF